jgi:hypothetical protein
MQISSWSTRDVEPRHCADYWRQVISEAVLGGSVNGMPGTGFVGSISARRLRDLAFASFDSSAHEIVRDRREIARDHGGAFLLRLRGRGPARTNGFGRWRKAVRGITVRSRATHGRGAAA